MKRIICLIGLRVMKLSVLAAARKKHKIFKPIIIPNMVDMVYNFCRFKTPTKMFFHYKARTSNIPISIAKRMVRPMKKNISLMFNISFIVRVIFSFLERGFVYLHDTLGSFVPRDGVFSKLSRGRKLLTFHPRRIAIFRTVKLFIYQTFLNIKTLFAPITFFKNSIFYHSSLLVKLSIFIILFSTSFVNPCHSATQWRNGVGENTILGSESVSDIDSVLYTNITKPLDTLLANFQEGCKIVYASASTITIQAGEVVVSNSGASIRLMLQNTSSTTVSFSDLDTGVESSSQTYYLYAYQETVGDSDFDITISTSSTAPSGKTYFLKLGSFYNDSSSNIDETLIVNDNETAYPSLIDPFSYDSGWFAVAVNNTYAKTHNLGTNKVISELWWSASSGGSSARRVEYNTAAGNDGYGSVLESLTTTQISIKTGSARVVGYYDGSGNLTGSSSGYFRVILLALE